MFLCGMVWCGVVDGTVVKGRLGSSNVHPSYPPTHRFIAPESLGDIYTAAVTLILAVGNKKQMDCIVTVRCFGVRVMMLGGDDARVDGMN